VGVVDAVQALDQQVAAQQQPLACGRGDQRLRIASLRVGQDNGVDLTACRGLALALATRRRFGADRGDDAVDPSSRFSLRSASDSAGRVIRQAAAARPQRRCSARAARWRQASAGLMGRSACRGPPAAFRCSSTR